MASCCASGPGSEQTSFATPAEAAGALAAAIRDDKLDDLAAIMGPESEEMLQSGDEVADRTGRRRFLALIAHYLDERNGFPARLRPQKLTWGSDYDHLSRKGEWADGDCPEDAW